MYVFHNNFLFHVLPHVGKRETCFVNFKLVAGFETFQVIVPLLVTEDEKNLVSCINCLTKVIVSCNLLSALQS